jgi:hypothetical protein
LRPRVLGGFRYFIGGGEAVARELIEPQRVSFGVVARGEVVGLLGREFGIAARRVVAGLLGLQFQLHRINGGVPHETGDG